MKLLKFYLAALAVIIVDQVVKLAVHYNMELGLPGEIPIFGDWFKLHYTLNAGMAFGIKFGAAYGKLALTLFRWLAMFAISYYIYYLDTQKMNQGFIWCIALILGGAVGNVLDSTFYGVFLEGNVFQGLPDAPPFYPWFHGKVVDMFYVDIWQGYLPEWMPMVGGKYYSFWPIFNVADSAIFIGVTIILIYQNRFFPKEENENIEESVAAE